MIIVSINLKWDIKQRKAFPLCHSLLVIIFRHAMSRFCHVKNHIGSLKQPFQEPVHFRPEICCH